MELSHSSTLGVAYSRTPRRSPPERLRIAQVAPLHESVPPKMYGGTERVVSTLTEELVRQGHDVTLFASGDSCTSATLVTCAERALRLDENCMFRPPHEAVMLDRVLARSGRFDIIHFHTDCNHFLLTRSMRTPSITTLHGRSDIQDLIPLYQQFSDAPLVAISDAQRNLLSWANWIGTVHHGISSENYHFSPNGGEYFAFLGRISPEKRVDRAIAIAIALETPLRIAAKVDAVDRDYFNDHIKHLLDHPLIEFVGEITEHEKSPFLGGAKALLFPIDWPEPFGLVMIESLACGTPVIAFRHGSVPEVVEHGKSGFVVDSLPEAIEAARNVGTISRGDCRAAFERRFTARHMAQNYALLYRKLIERRPYSRVRAAV